MIGCFEHGNHTLLRFNRHFQIYTRDESSKELTKSNSTQAQDSNVDSRWTEVSVPLHLEACPCFHCSIRIHASVIFSTHSAKTLNSCRPKTAFLKGRNNELD